MSGSSSRLTEWSQSFEVTRRKIDVKRKANEPFSATETRAFNAALSSLETQLNAMAASPMQYEAPASEVARRRSLVENMKKVLSKAAVGTSFSSQANSNSNSNSSYGNKSNSNNNNSNSSSNNKYHGAGSSTSSTYSPLGTNSPGEPSDSRSQSMKQQEMIQMQDEILSEFSRGLDRIHNQATTMGEETKVHMRLLDDLDSSVDATSNALEAETKHADRIAEKGKVFYMYICVVVEVIIIIIMLILIF